MVGRIEALVGSVAGMGAGVAAALPDSDIIESVGRWPLVAILGAVCCFCVWIIYRQGCQYGQRLDKLADAIRQLAENLKERPCVRHREND